MGNEDMAPDAQSQFDRKTNDTPGLPRLGSRQLAKPPPLSPRRTWRVVGREDEKNQEKKARGTGAFGLDLAPSAPGGPCLQYGYRLKAALYSAQNR